MNSLNRLTIRWVGVLLILIAGSFISFALAGSLFGRDTNHPTDDEMSVEKAQQLIASGNALDTIPKSVWKQILDEDTYRILWKKGTERPFTGELLNNQEKGIYVSAGCRIPVFRSDHKFKSGTGWPSFWEVFDENNVILKPDNSWGMKRTEVLSKCGEHLGHVFEDGPEPTGLRYCINSLALDFVPKSTARPDNSLPTER